jgi:S1-C subfamily serine protease
VFALGTPLTRALQSTLTRGIVSARRSLGGKTYLQADVAISTGNSGGPLLDKMGNVVGISVAGFNVGENLNLFIPINEALSALNIHVDAN